MFGDRKVLIEINDFDSAAAVFVQRLPLNYFLHLVGKFVICQDPGSKLRYILRDARFFLIKSNNHENVSLAKAKVS